MEPLTMAGISFGLNAIGSGLGFLGQQDQARQNNKAIKARNRYSMQQYAYGEQMKDFEHKNALKIYDMRVEQSRLQNQEYDNAWKEYYMDEQIQFEEILNQAKIQALQSNMQLENAQNAYTASALNRGAVGRRAGVRGANAALLAAMGNAERGRQLSLAQDNMDTRMGRQARRTNLRKQMSFNAIGPRPERTPVAPLPFMESMDRGPSSMGLFSGLLNDAGSAFGTYTSLKAPSAGNIADAAKPPGATTGIGPLRNGAMYGAAISN